MNFSETCLLIVVVLFVASCIHYAISHVVHGEDFHYNMTKQMKEETRLLSICIETDIKIPNCNMIYGGNGYGDAR